MSYVDHEHGQEHGAGYGQPPYSSSSMLNSPCMDNVILTFKILSEAYQNPSNPYAHEVQHVGGNYIYGDTFVIVIVYKTQSNQIHRAVNPHSPKRLQPLQSESHGGFKVSIILLRRVLKIFFLFL